MRALIVTTGSRGDVQPFTALALALRRRGHDAVLAAPGRFAPLVSRHGVDFAALDEGTLALQDELAGRGTLAALTSARRVAPALRAWLDDVAGLAGTACDVVVFAPKALGAADLADRLGVPAVPLLAIPLYTPTREFASPLLPFRPPAAANRASWRLAAAVEAPYRRMLRRWRAEKLGLGPAPALPERIASSGAVHAWSRHLLPAPADWPTAAAPLGALHLPPGQGRSLPGELVRFLRAGGPPVYVGFGSTVHGDPAGLTRTVVEGVRRSGRRAVLATGWGALSPGSAPWDDVLVVDEVPHDLLLPHVAAAVHHGGAGTVAAAMRAGVPQAVRPFVGDQWFWGDRVHRTGAGPAPLTGRLTPERLAAAIDRALACSGRAGELAGAVAQEEAAAADRVVERVLAAAV
ncbi:glycosyltransferase [Nocardiopsis sp. CC223A]|uniref:glycosyltransferase n=1 Tax=Nocardiopsis sp. CC223A TaxID=3044051 RepID=UPI0027956C04|nr:glycosyltransferase [Nocardiopsis sp. CC223A]